MKSFNVGILGATGAVGQKFIRLLDNHPWFNIHTLGASERSAGKKYPDAAQWVEETTMPARMAEMEVASCEPANFKDVDFVFSGLDASAADTIEPAFAKAGIPVISNAKNYRMHDQVPLLVPEVNPDHIQLIRHQTFHPEGKGWIVTNPNCVVVPLVMALKPLQESFGIEAVIVTSMQAISGGGYPGVPSMDILGNVIPYIGGEESKIETEPLKLLGKLNGNSVSYLDFPLHATATRVPVRNGHMLSVTVKLKNRPGGVDKVLSLFKNWESPLAGKGLPSAPDKPLFVHDEQRFPQPLLHADKEQGMQTAIGRVRAAGVFDFGFVAMAHNTIRGAAGGAILNAELLAVEGYI